MSEAGKLLGFAIEGARVRRAAGTLEQASPQLASALRRAMPFLARSGAQVSLVFARAIPIGELLGDLPRPIHATHLVVQPGGARGAVVLDAGLIGLILDGVLGGDGSSPPQLEPAGLTPPQVALLSRVVDGVVRSFSEVLSKRLSIALHGSAPDGDDAGSEAAPIACSFEIATSTQQGRVVLLVAKEALLGGAEAPRAVGSSNVDPRVANVVEQVELDLVAELARLRMTLGHLARLRVGDMVRLDVPVGGAINVRADGHVVLRGHPTTNAGQIAIRIAK
jgi:flagellar motor switch protein FliM